MTTVPIPQIPQAREAVDIKTGDWTPAMRHWLTAVVRKLTDLEARVAALEGP